MKILKEGLDEDVVVATHGTSLSTIINYYDRSFLYEGFNSIKDIMPWIIVIGFNDKKFLRMEEADF